MTSHYLVVCVCVCVPTRDNENSPPVKNLFKHMKHLQWFAVVLCVLV